MGINLNIFEFNVTHLFNWISIMVYIIWFINFKNSPSLIITIPICICRIIHFRATPHFIFHAYYAVIRTTNVYNALKQINNNSSSFYLLINAMALRLCQIFFMCKRNIFKHWKIYSIKIIYVAHRGADNVCDYYWEKCIFNFVCVHVRKHCYCIWATSVKLCTCPYAFMKYICMYYIGVIIISRLRHSVLGIK